MYTMCIQYTYTDYMYTVYSPYAQLLTPQLLTHAQLLTVFEQSIFGNSYASNAKAYFQLLTLF